MQAEVPRGSRSTLDVPALDRIKFKSLNRYPCVLNIEAGVRDDGTLLFWWPSRDYLALNPRLFKIGKESDWAAVASGFYQLVALKTDGTVWSWDLLQGHQPASVAVLQKQPKRVGTHSDWLAVGCWYGQSVGLSADGTFWDLPSAEANIGSGYDNRVPWLAPSRRASKIENIFGATE